MRLEQDKNGFPKKVNAWQKITSTTLYSDLSSKALLQLLLAVMKSAARKEAQEI